MNAREAAHAARLIADRSIDPAAHRLALALEAAVWCEDVEAKRLLADEPEIDVSGCPPPPVAAIRIERP